MCDYFLPRMEGDQAGGGGGDLTDIVRSGGAIPGNAAEMPSTAAADEWQLQGDPTMLFPPLPSSTTSEAVCSAAGGTGADVFVGADPFSGLVDPFSTDYYSGAGDFLDAMPDAMAKVRFDTAIGSGSSCGGGGGSQLIDMSRKQPLLAPRGLQMPAVGVLSPRMVLPSPLSPREIRPYRPLSGDMVKLGITAGQVAGCAIDAAVVGMQMSSPRAVGGIKRRLGRSAWIQTHLLASLHHLILHVHIYTCNFFPTCLFASYIAPEMIFKEGSAISFFLFLLLLLLLCSAVVCTAPPWKKNREGGFQGFLGLCQELARS